MALYDTCTNKDIAQKTLISSLVDANCNVPYNLGKILKPKNYFKSNEISVLELNGNFYL